MGNLNALSYIHGEMRPLLETLKKIDFENPESRIIFLRDYINGGPNSAQVISFILKLTKKYPNNVIALNGNHVEGFILVQMN